MLVVVGVGLSCGSGGVTAVGVRSPVGVKSSVRFYLTLLPYLESKDTFLQMMVVMNIGINE